MALTAPDPNRRIAERLRLREIHIFSLAVECGSMAAAAARLGITQPVVSEAIAVLEAALKTRLLDRGPRGVTATAAGEALLRRGLEAFDALAQGIRDIALLSDPGAGEVIIGASESHVAGGFLADVVLSLTQRHPMLSVRVIEANTADPSFRELRARNVDLMLGRFAPQTLEDDLRADILFHEELLVVAGGQTPWAHRPGIDFADLVECPWVLAPPKTAVYDLVLAAFRNRGLAMPQVAITTYSMNLRLQLLTAGEYLTAFPASLVEFNAGRWDLKVLPLSLGQKLPVAIVTLKSRPLSPAVQAFIAHALAAGGKLTAAAPTGSTETDRRTRAGTPG